MDEWVNWPWREMLLTSTFLPGIAIAFILLVSKYPSSRFLGKIVVLNLLFIISFAFETSYTFTYVTLTSMSVGIFLYSRAFFIQNTRVPSKHLLPIVFATILPFVPNLEQFELIARALTSLLVIGYLASAVHFIRKEGKTRGVNWFQNPGSRLIWFRNFFSSLLLMKLFWLVSFTSLSIEQVLACLLLQLCFIYYQVIKESAFFTPIPIGNKYKKSTLTAEQKHSILSKLDVMLTNEKFYLNDNVSLSHVATQLNTTTHHLSQVINEYKGISFQKLIAKHRMQEAKILLKNSQYNQTTIENIAETVGYNSKSAFNTTFKKHTGLTPTEYRESGGVRSYREERLPERKRHYSVDTFASSYHVLSLNQLYDMVTNFFKIFSRTLIRNKVFSAINIFGLTVGFTCCILISLFISDELSFDRSLPEYDHIYRVAWVNENPQTRTPHPLALAMVKDLPEVAAATSISPWYGPGLNLQSLKVENVKKNLLFEEPDFFFADSTFLDVFDLEVTAGDKEALKKPWGLVITEEMAVKYFKGEDPIGQELIVDEMPIAVTAVVKGLPQNSHFHFRAILSYVSLKTINPDNPWFAWEDFGHFNYIKVKSGVNPKVLESKIPKMILPYLDWSQERVNALNSSVDNFVLQPITSIHLNSHLRWELENNGNILYIYILAGTFVFLLLIVAINYVNLTTAKSLDRAKEIGVRKTLGAKSRSLKVQFYVESFLFCMVSLLLAFGFSIILLETFSHLTSKVFVIADIINTQFITKALIIGIFIALIAGLYPAFILTAFEPSKVLKGQFSNSGQGNRLRSVLVVAQFVVSAILITGSLIILKQIDYMKSKELGFDQKAVISIRIHQNVELGGIDILKLKDLQTQFQTIAGVTSTSAISNLPGQQFNQNPTFLESDPTNSIDASEMYVDFDVAKVLNFEVINGRHFDRSFESDLKGTNFIVNERFIEQLNVDDPVGKVIVWDNDWQKFTGTIVGVVKDFHFKSLHESIQPLIIRIDPFSINHLIVKMEGQQFQQTLSAMKNAYETIENEVPFEYYFLDQQLEELYHSEIRTLNVFSIFAAIALFLACLGLLGMAIAMLNQKIKEVGIRKIMGASSQQIIQMILSQFVKLITFALLIGIPTAYFLTQKWMNEFSYKVEIGIMPFLIASALLFIVAIASVSAVVLKIAFANPADTLRYE